MSSPAGGPAKLAVPVASRLVARPRLHTQLTAGLDCPVTVVAAAAGWGKTLLAASWIAAGAGGRTAAWVRLDAADDDVVDFWGSLAEALVPAVGPQAAAALRALAAGTTEADDLPGAFAAAMRRADRPVVLVLDNLHEVTSERVHQGLVRFVERPPPMLSLLVLTRRDPPWPLSRLRLTGLMSEVRAADLAFRVDEARELLSGLDLDLDQNQVRRLVERTEGWAAGLRLVALHLQGRADAGADLGAAIAAFSGDDHSVAGYLVTEVLGTQPAELVEFLRKISVVDLVCADLADALTGRRDSEQLLAELAASHLFVQAVDRPGRWYHLHRLIGDILRARPTPRRERRDLHRRATEWFRRNGMPLDAIRAATTGRLWALAADLVGRHAIACVLGGRARELEHLLTGLPRAQLAAHAELGCGLAGARIARGNSAEVAELLEAARSGLGHLPEARAARARLLLDLVAGALARVRGDWDAVAALYRGVDVDPVALTRLDMDAAELVPVLVNNILGVAALLDGDLPEADRRLRAGVSTDLRLRAGVSTELATPVLSQINAAAYLALLKREWGELDAAEAAALDVVSRGAAAGLERAAQVVGAYLTMAGVALDRADLREVDDWLARVAEVEAVAGEPHVRLLAALVLAARREAAGDLERSLSGLRATVAELDLAALPATLRARTSLAEAALVARLGDATRARVMLDGIGRAATPAVAAGSARLLLSLGDRSAALAARARVEAPVHPRERVDVGLLDAALAVAAGDETAALARIEDALAGAAPFALRRPFLDGATDLRPLLEQRLERGTVVPAFVVDLLERASGTASADEPTRAHLDPLTDRERTVLRYLTSALTNAEIAAELYVSVNTVKSHERALYRKLGAANRREAVHRARALELL